MYSIYPCYGQPIYVTHNKELDPVDNKFRLQIFVRLVFSITNTYIINTFESPNRQDQGFIF